MFLNKPHLIAVGGAVLGAILGFLAIVAAGAGHGTYTLVAMTSSPLGIGGIPIGLLGGPIVWGTMAFLVAKSSQRKERRLFVLAVAVHYTVGILLILVSEFADWDRLNKV